jgi:hypothetical protein
MNDDPSKPTPEPADQDLPREVPKTSHPPSPGWYGEWIRQQQTEEEDAAGNPDEEGDVVEERIPPPPTDGPTE